MEKITTDEMLNKYAKESKNIQYSTRLFEKKSEDSGEKPTIILRDLIKEKEGKEEKNIWTIILKYEIKGAPQEVVMGMLGDTAERKDKAKEIINLIIKQLEENVISQAGYEHYTKLSQYVQTENIPFRLTMEGIEILSSKSKENISIPRTYYINTQGKLDCRYTQKELEEMKEQRKTGISEYMKKQRILQKWNERRTKILESFNGEKQKQSFLKGEGITEFINKTDKNKNAKKDIIAEYLLESFEKDDKDSPRFNLAKGYLNIKEKGIVIEIKRNLEDIENRYYKAIEENKGNVSLEEYNRLETIEDYKNFFDLVKVGKDWNARLNFKIKKIDFDTLRKLFKAINYNDKEVLEYLDLKEDMIKDIQTEEIEADYNKHDSVKELYKFLLHSSIREKTQDDDEHIVSGIYDHVKREIIENNYEEVELYNHYAEKSEMPICNLPQTKKEKPLSSIAKKICEDIDSKNKEENKEER